MDLFCLINKKMSEQKKENKLPGSGYAFVNLFCFKLFLSLYIMWNEMTPFFRNPYKFAYECFFKNL